MAPTSRGRGRGSFRGRPGRGRSSLGGYRSKFRSSRTEEVDEPNDIANIDPESEEFAKEDAENGSTSESEEDDPHAAQSYGTLLQLLQASPEQAHTRKRRKIELSIGMNTRESVDGKNVSTKQHLRPAVDKQPGKETQEEVNPAEEGEDLEDEEVSKGDDVAEVVEEDEDDDPIDDPFQTHFSSPDEDHLASKLKAISENNWSSKAEDGEDIKKVRFAPAGAEGHAAIKTTRKIGDFNIKEKLSDAANSILPALDVFEQTIAPYLYNYQDVLLAGRTPENAQKLRNLVSLHVLNHVLKTRDRVVRNNTKLAKDPDLELRDQGFTRPKVLFILPTRQSCVKVINTLMGILRPEQQENKKRFLDSYSQPLDQWEDKPTDFQELFSGNDDDMFRIGLKITRKTVKFFSPFYTSDIILASPLGLRATMEKATTSSDKKGDHDFLSSIEICILDQAEALLMQNWQHTLHIFAHLNLLPKESHNTDFSRVRTWYLDNNSNHLRQTLVFSAFLTPDLNSLFSTFMRPVAGKVKITPRYAGAILSLPVLPHTITLKQTFIRVSSPKLQSESQTRLTHFLTAVLPSLVKSPSISTLVFVPNHAQFLSLRNHLSTSQTTASISFAAISEYTSVPDVARARSHFLRGRHSLLLYTERAHHFRRYRLKGIRRIVMLGLPENSLFYGELVGMLGLGAEEEKGGRESRDVKVLFSKWDALKLERVVGTERVGGMLREKGGDTFEFL